MLLESGLFVEAFGTKGWVTLSHILFYLQSGHQSLAWPWELLVHQIQRDCNNSDEWNIFHVSLELSWPRWIYSSGIESGLNMWKWLQIEWCFIGFMLLFLFLCSELARRSSANACQTPDSLSPSQVGRSTTLYNGAPAGLLVVCMLRWYLWHGTSSSAAYNICMWDPWCHEADWILTSWWLALPRNSLVKINIAVTFWVSEMVQTAFQVHGVNDVVIYIIIYIYMSSQSSLRPFRWCGGIMQGKTLFPQKHHMLPKRNLLMKRTFGDPNDLMDEMTWLM